MYMKHLSEHLWDVALANVSYWSSQGKEGVRLLIDKAKREI